MINSDKYMLDKSFQDILYRINNWISEGSGWVIEIIESVEAEYVNISIYSPLSGSTYIELPRRLRNSMKGLINIKNNCNKCFLWRHVRHLNPLITHPERITKADKKRLIILIMKFCYENNLVYPVHVSDEKFENCMDLLMITDESKSHYVYIKDFNRIMCNKTKSKNKKLFCKYYLQCFSSERVRVEHTEICLEINGKQTVKLRSGSIKFKNHFKQLAVTLKIYDDFESFLKAVTDSDKKIMLHALKNIRHIFLAVLLAKLFVLMINLVNQLFFTRKKMQSIDLLKQILKSMIIVKVRLKGMLIKI